MTPKYALHPGWITSQADGDRHYVGIVQLARLYGLPTGSYIVWVEDAGLRWEDYTHLWPRYDGHYVKVGETKRHDHPCFCFLCNQARERGLTPPHTTPKSAHIGGDPNEDFHD